MPPASPASEPFPSTFLELMTLEQVAADYFVGPSPDYRWGRLYGGQVVSQALRAAYATVDAPHRVHSLHAYFVLAGATKQPVLFEVDRVRDGRSFTTRRVIAQQNDGAILTLDASFQRTEDEPDLPVHAIADDLPAPEATEPCNWTSMADVREPISHTTDGRSWVWMKINQELGDPEVPANGVLHDCALAYLSDHSPLSAALACHPAKRPWEELMAASLDHAIWFQRRVRADRWILFDNRAAGLVNARGIAFGTAHSIEGVHAATVAQEGLVRSPKPAP